MNQMKLLDILAGRNLSPFGGMVRGLATLGKPFYAAAVNRRNKRFDSGARVSHRLPKPTISVGNITTGGTGKTPMVIELCNRLLTLNQRPAVLMRGYKSVNGKSDEAMLLQNALGDHVVVQANPNRREGAEQALAHDPWIDVFVLDDGFQHRQVHRDVDLVLIDAVEPFGFGHLLPRGTLREPLASLSRADGVIITRVDQVDMHTIAEIEQKITQFSAEKPIIHAAYDWIGYRDAWDVEHPLEVLQGDAVIGVCGIGNPVAFSRSLAHATDKVIEEIRLDDHHHYTMDEIVSLHKHSREKGATAIVTTEKDYIKWPRETIDNALPVYQPVLQTTLTSGEEVLDALLQKVLA